MIIHNILWWLDKGASWLARSFITVYQRTLSPDKGLPSFWLKWRVCVHEPHCSAYWKECFERYPFFTALHYTMERVSQCTPAHQKIVDPSSYRVVFFSSAPIWEPFLRALHSDKRYDVVWVATQPPAPSWRWMKLRPNHIQAVSEELYWSSEDFVQTPRSLRLKSKKYWEEAKQFADWIEKKKPDFIIVVAYGNILPQSVLDVPQFWPINVHWSLLPEYRWASPLQSVFLDERKESWVTIMRMSAWLDEWPILTKHVVPFGINDTVKDFIEVLKEKSPQWCLDTTWEYWKGRIEPIEQNGWKATHCGKIAKEDGLVDPWNNELHTLFAKYKAYALWPKTYFILESWKRVVVEKIEVNETLYDEHKSVPLLNEKNECNEAITTLLVKQEWKKTVDWDAFLRWLK